MVVGYMSFDGILPDNEFEYFKMATCMVPGVMVALGVLSLLKTQRKRLSGRYEKDPISTVALVILEVIMVAVVIGVSIGAAFLANYLYTI